MTPNNTDTKIIIQNIKSVTIFYLTNLIHKRRAPDTAGVQYLIIIKQFETLKKYANDMRMIMSK